MQVSINRESSVIAGTGIQSDDYHFTHQQQILTHTILAAALHTLCSALAGLQLPFAEQV